MHFQDSTSQPHTPRCLCAFGFQLCPVGFRLKGRLDAEYELSSHNGIWGPYNDTLAQAQRHVAEFVGL